MELERGSPDRGSVDMRPIKENLRKKLPAESIVLSDLLKEPDSMPIAKAEVLIPHYLQRLERELEKYESKGPFVLKA
jgi:hypothetical protein